MSGVIPTGSSSEALTQYGNAVAAPFRKKREGIVHYLMSRALNPKQLMSPSLRDKLVKSAKDQAHANFLDIEEAAFPKEFSETFSKTTRIYPREITFPRNVSDKRLITEVAFLIATQPSVRILHLPIPFTGPIPFSGLRELNRPNLLQMISSPFNRLEELDLSDGEFDSEDLCEAVKLLNLLSLTLCEDLREDILQKLAPLTPSLVRLDLSVKKRRDRPPSHYDLLEIPKNCWKKLEELDLSGLIINEGELPGLFNKMPQLCTLKLNDTLLNRADLIAIATLQDLEVLSLVRVSLEEIPFEVIENVFLSCKKLRSLDLSEVQMNCVTWIKLISGFYFKDLKIIYVKNMCCHVKVLEFIAATGLNLEAMHVSFDGANLVQELKILSRFKRELFLEIGKIKSPSDARHKPFFQDIESLLAVCLNILIVAENNLSNDPENWINSTIIPDREAIYYLQEMDDAFLDKEKNKYDLVAAIIQDIMNALIDVKFGDLSTLDDETQDLWVGSGPYPNIDQRESFVIFAHSPIERLNVLSGFFDTVKERLLERIANNFDQEHLQRLKLKFPYIQL